MPVKEVNVKITGTADAVDHLVDAMKAIGHAYPPNELQIGAMETITCYGMDDLQKGHLVGTTDDGPKPEDIGDCKGEIERER